MNPDTAISLVALALALLLAAVLAGKGIGRSAPAFVVYICFDLASTALGLAVFLHSGFSRLYWYGSVCASAIEFPLCCAVLVELARNLLRSNREFFPRWQLAASLFIGISIFGMGLARWVTRPGAAPYMNLYVLTMRAREVLEFSGFLTLIAWSSLRKFHWPERELRIVTGFGLSTFSWFLVSLLHARWNGGSVYHWLDQSGQIVDLLVLAYWLHYFLILAPREPVPSRAKAEQERDAGPAESEHSLRLDLPSRQEAP